ncbi:MAG: hypothetical protein R3E08_11360 [Thiotrichaceae bacterium]
MTRVWLIPWVIMLTFIIIISLFAGFLIGDWGKTHPPVDPSAKSLVATTPNPPTDETQIKDKSIDNPPTQPADEMQTKDKSTDNPPTQKPADDIPTEKPPSKNLQANSSAAQNLPNTSITWKQITQYIQQSEVIRAEMLNTVLQKLPELALLPHSQFTTQATVSTPISWKILSLQLEIAETQQQEVLNRFLEKIDE